LSVFPGIGFLSLASSDRSHWMRSLEARSYFP
jgi:hypothetical protein